MARRKKSLTENTNLTLPRRIKHPAVKLATELGFRSLSELVTRTLEVQLLKRGLIEPEPAIEPMSDEELRPVPSRNKKPLTA